MLLNGLGIGNLNQNSGVNMLSYNTNPSNF